MMTTPTDAKLAAYTRTNVETRSEPQLLVDLCERARVAVDAARTTDDRTVQRASLQRAREIVAFLQDSLSVEVGGAVAVNLMRHYTFLNHTLIEALDDIASADLDMLHGKFAELHETWREAVSIFQEQEADAEQE
jgi:flagellar biosynthetic protein FliS